MNISSVYVETKIPLSFGNIRINSGKMVEYIGWDKYIITIEGMTKYILRNKEDQSIIDTFRTLKKSINWINTKYEIECTGF